MKLTNQVSSICHGIPLLALLVCCLGCGGATLRSHQIPYHVQAQPPVNMANVDLASMGVTNLRSDLVYPGDVIECTVTPGVDQPVEVWEGRVSETGAIDVPYVGPVIVANQSLAANELLIRRASIEHGVYRDPIISLDVKRRQTNRVEVIGAVRRPGVYEIPTQRSNLVAAVTAAGGALPSANEIAEVYDSTASSNGKPIRVNIPRGSSSGEGNIYISDGSVLYVGHRKKQQVQVLGNASTNRTVELSPEHATRLLDVLAEVGGLRYSNWICDVVKVTRNVPETNNETVVIKLSVKKAREDLSENILLADGDVIHVDENPITFTLNTVQGLMGVGASAARFAIP